MVMEEDGDNDGGSPNNRHTLERSNDSISVKNDVMSGSVLLFTGGTCSSSSCW